MTNGPLEVAVKEILPSQLFIYATLCYPLYPFMPMMDHWRLQLRKYCWMTIYFYFYTDICQGVHCYVKSREAIILICVMVSITIIIWSREKSVKQKSHSLDCYVWICSRESVILICHSVDCYIRSREAVLTIIMCWDIHCYVWSVIMMCVMLYIAMYGLQKLL